MEVCEGWEVRTRKSRDWEQPKPLTGSSTHRKYTVRDIHTGRDGDGGGRQAGAGGRDDNRRRLLAGTKGHHCTVTWTWQTSETAERVHPHTVIRAAKRQWQQGTPGRTAYAKELVEVKCECGSQLFLQASLATAQASQH